MYRDALEAAHKRIAELEARLDERPKRRRSRAPLFVGMGITTALLAIATVVVARGHRAPRAVIPMPAVTFPAPPLSLAHDYADALMTPFSPDVDEDGVEDVVAKFRDVRESAQPTYVRAVSGRTFEPLWTAGPFEDANPSNVAVVGDRVVVTTSQGASILDLKTGANLRSFTTKMKSACAAIQKPGVALLLPDIAVDVHTGVVSAADRTDRCDWMAPNTCAVSSMPCFADALKDESVHARDHKVHGWTTLVDGPHRVSYGYLLPSRDFMVAAGAVGSTRTLWERDATLENEPMTEIEHVTNYQSMMAALNDDRFVLAYGTPRGIRVTARDASTGVLRWNTLLTDHPRNAALRATAARIYVHSDWHISVIDGVTGAPLGTVGE